MHYERHELKTGLRVVIAPMAGVASATCALFVGAGSRYESSENAGVAHLLEHLLFKGTARRPSSRAVSETIDAVGGILNAGTDKETTVYWAKVAAQHVSLSLDLLADMILNSRLTPGDVSKERSIIIEELSTSIDDPTEWVHNLVDQIIWGDHPLGRDVGGTRASVSSLKRSQVTAFMHDLYGGSNAVLVVAGGIEANKVLKEAEIYFGAWDAVPGRSFSPAPEFPRSTDSATESRETEQTHLCIAFPGLNRASEHRYALDILTTILGGSTTSRLFLEMRERLALAYDIHVYAPRYSDTGAIVISCGVDTNRVAEAIEAVMAEVQRIKRRIVGQAEFRKTIEYMKGRLFLGLEDTQAVASWLGAQELLMGQILLPHEVVQRVETESPRSIRNLANDLLDISRARLAAIGPGADGISASLSG